MTVHRRLEYARIRSALILGLLVLCTYWIFFDTYRVNAFNIIPHDDYAPYLLAIVGDDGGAVPGSPFVYRYLSVLVAVPFYFVLPVYEFSFLDGANTEYLRAVEALAMVSYLAILGCSILAFLMTTRRFSGTTSAGAIGGLLMLLIMQFSGYKGVDPVGILILFALLFFVRRPVLFGVLIALSVGFNEKITLVMSMLMVSRLLLERDRRFLVPAALSVLGFCAYLSLRMTLDVPGNEHQLQVTSFLSNAWSNVIDLFSLKRIILVIFPLSLLTTMYFLALDESRENRNAYQDYFSVADIFALLGLFAVTLAMGMRFGVGRVLMFSAPIYLPLAAIRIEKLLQTSQTSQRE